VKPARSISTANPAVLVVAMAIANVASVRPSPKARAFIGAGGSAA
jgi:hypothetical protein